MEAADLELDITSLGLLVRLAILSNILILVILFYSMCSCSYWALLVTIMN